MWRISLAFAVLLLAGCSAAGAGTPAAAPVTTADVQKQREADFLTAVRPNLQLMSEDRAVDVGYQICKQLRLGNLREEQVALWTAENFPQDSGYGTGLMAVAVSAPGTLCPDWMKS